MSAITIVDVQHALNNSTDTTQPKPAAPSPRTARFHLLSLPPPDSSSPTRDYLTLSNQCHPHPLDIYEIQTVRPNHGKYASYFLGSRIISNPSLHVATRVDPLFFLLNHFHRSSSDSTNLRWQPLDQLLADVPHSIRRASNLSPELDGGAGQLGHLLDVSDAFGDEVVCRFSEARTMRWLRAKYDRCVEAVRVRTEGRKRRMAAWKSGGFGAFSSSFAMAEERKDEVALEEDGAEGGGLILSKEEERAVRVGALQLLCEYLPSPWRTKLAEAVGLSDEDWMGKTTVRGSSTPTDDDEECSPGKKRRRASWEGALGQAEADDMLCLTTTGRTAGEGSTMITPIEKNSVKNAQSVGLKRLAKVNTKGMKSLTSFFGGGAKKK